MRLVLAVLIFVQSAQGAVLVQGPGTLPLDYRAALKADPDILSPTQQLLKQRPAAGRRDALLNAFASAQKAFLENSGVEARGLFEKVAGMMNAADWTRTDRQILLHAFLRLAQLQADNEKQNYWLARAVAAGDDTEPEGGVFPPPIVAGLKKFRSEMPRVSVREEVFTAGWTTVLLNGSICSAKTCPGIPVGEEKVRVTFLSDTWQSVTLNLTAQELSSATPTQVAWATGDCSKTQFSPASAALKDPQAFWGLDCEAAPVKTLNLQPVAQTQALPRLEIKEISPAFYKSKWFWMGVGVLAAGALIANGQKREKEDREPTTTYGYQ